MLEVHKPDQSVVLSWPTLINPYQTEPTVRVWDTLCARQAAFGFWRRNWWRTKRRGHQFGRAAKNAVRSVYDEIASAPKKTLFDIVTGLPIALLAIAPVRDLAVTRTWMWEAYATLVTARVLYAAWRRGSLGEVKRKEATAALSKVMPVIELSSIHVRAAARQEYLPADQLHGNIKAVLQAIVALTRQALQVPEGVGVSANLMLPMAVVVEESEGTVPGCGIVAYDTVPPDPSWTRLVHDDLGAGRVLSRGKVQAIDDTTDPVWCGLLGKSRAKCFISLPVRAARFDVIAVVNVDADRPMVLRRSNAADLFDVLAAPLKLLSDLLVAAASRTANPEN